MCSRAQIVDRDYELWDRPHIVLDTAGKSAQDTIAELCEALGSTRAPPVRPP